MKSEYDIIIIGTGAGGGTLARHLAPSGKSILLLERGGWLKREPDNWSAYEVFEKGRYVSKGTWRDKHGKEFQPGTFHYVGGATKMYGAALFRLREKDFSGFAHYDGVSPAWPISYTDMEPYYLKAEHMYQVHGIRGEDPTEPPASGPYLFPPVSHEARIQKLSDDLARDGYHPFHAPCGIMLNEANMEYSTCIRCKDCDGFPCPLHAKSDAETLGVRPALEHPNVELQIHAEVIKLKTNSEGTAVTEVVVRLHGSEIVTIKANVVISSCGAANSARLLLMSASDKHPHGLANGSDQVGRNYMFHTSQAVLAISKEENHTQFQKTLGIHDFYFGMDGFDYPVGSIQMVGKSQAPMFRGEEPIKTALAPTWVLERLADHAIDFWLMTEDLPKPENRITVDRDGHITLNYSTTNKVPCDKLYHKLKSMLGSLDMHETLIPRSLYLKTDVGVAGVAHQSGTVVFGSDPKTSVLDRNCKAHELDNLYVVDTSFFPSIGAVNPALTAMANAIRVGDAILERFK
jgi:choline dehydrogenase-like flavoprotein